MKTPILLLTIISLLIIASIVVVTFDVPARINYSINRMVSFSGENYTITDSPTDKKCGI